MTLIACGGGGASVAQNRFAGTWTGTFSLKRFVNSVQSGSTVTGSAHGVVTGTGVVGIKFYKQLSPDIFDQIAGQAPACTLDINDQITGINYFVDTSSSGGGLLGYNSTSQFSLVAGQMIGVLGGTGDTTNNFAPNCTFTVNFTMNKQ